MIKPTDAPFPRPIGNLGEYSWRSWRHTLDSWNVQRQHLGNPGASHHVTGLALPHLCAGSLGLVPPSFPALARFSLLPALLYDVGFQKRWKGIPPKDKKTDRDV